MSRTESCLAGCPPSCLQDRPPAAPCRHQRSRRASAVVPTPPLAPPARLPAFRGARRDAPLRTRCSAGLIPPPACPLACYAQPCRGARRDATFENVLKKPLAFPEQPAISPACKDLITRLLNKVGAAALLAVGLRRA